MRPLNANETQIFFEKLAKFIGTNGKNLICRTDAEWVFRVHKKRVYYMRKALADLCPAFGFHNCLSAGMCVGKFTKKGRFFLTITALPILAQYAQYKVWLKPSAEVGFLYGTHIIKDGVRDITEGTPRNAGVVIYNENDTPIGLGVAVQSSVSLRLAAPTIIAVVRQGDLGEYLRSETSI